MSVPARYDPTTFPPPVPGAPRGPSPHRFTTLIALAGLVVLGVGWVAWERRATLLPSPAPRVSSAAPDEPVVTIPARVLEDVALRAQNARALVIDATGRVGVIQTRVREVGPFLRNNGYTRHYRALIEADNVSTTTRRLIDQAVAELDAADATINHLKGATQ
jgi:hypothetical protein